MTASDVASVNEHTEVVDALHQRMSLQATDDDLEVSYVEVIHEM